MKHPQIENVLSGRQDTRLLFTELQRTLQLLHFDCKIVKKNYIYSRFGVEEIINLQRYGDFNKAKPYQVKLVREIINKYHLEARL